MVVNALFLLSSRCTKMACCHFIGAPDGAIGGVSAWETRMSLSVPCWVGRGGLLLSPHPHAQPANGGCTPSPPSPFHLSSSCLAHRLLVEEGSCYRGSWLQDGQAVTDCLWADNSGTRGSWSFECHGGLWACYSSHFGCSYPSGAFIPFLQCPKRDASP